MKFLHILILVFCCISFSAPVWAQRHVPGLAERVTHRSVFNQLTDSLATAGKSEIERERIIRQRVEARRLDRLQKIHSANVKKKQKEKRKFQRQLHSQK